MIGTMIGTRMRETTIGTMIGTRMRETMIGTRMRETMIGTMIGTRMSIDGCEAVQNLRMTISKALQESAAAASTKALMLEVCLSSLRKNKRQLRSIDIAATVVGLRLRVLSSIRQASLRQWLRISMPPQCPRICSNHCSGLMLSADPEHRLCCFDVVFIDCRQANPR